jgi:hypothetical protein
MFEFFVGFRFLKPRRKQVLVSVISLISVLGVAVGVATLIIVIAVITGTSGVERVKGATMKRLLCVLLVVIFAVSFVGCKKEADKKPIDNTTTAPK